MFSDQLTDQFSMETCEEEDVHPQSSFFDEERTESPRVDRRTTVVQGLICGLNVFLLRGCVV